METEDLATGATWTIPVSGVNLHIDKCWWDQMLHLAEQVNPVRRRQRDYLRGSMGIPANLIKGDGR